MKGSFVYSRDDMSFKAKKSRETKDELIDELNDALNTIDDLKRQTDHLLQENSGLCERIFGKQRTRDIQFRVEYFDNSCGNALELYTNMEMMVSERITKDQTKEMILSRIFDEIRKKLGVETKND